MLLRGRVLRGWGEHNVKVWYINSQISKGCLLVCKVGDIKIQLEDKWAEDIYSMWGFNIKKRERIKI
jgi:hypothetical protein